MSTTGSNMAAPSVQHERLVEDQDVRDEVEVELRSPYDDPMAGQRMVHGHPPKPGESLQFGLSLCQLCYPGRYLCDCTLLIVPSPPTDPRCLHLCLWEHLIHYILLHCAFVVHAFFGTGTDKPIIKYPSSAPWIHQMLVKFNSSYLIFWTLETSTQRRGHK